MFRKHVKDFSVSKETNDLGIVNVDLTADILFMSTCWFIIIIEICIILVSVAFFSPWPMGNQTNACMTGRINAWLVELMRDWSNVYTYSMMYAAKNDQGCCNIDVNRIEQCCPAHINCSQLSPILLNIVTPDSSSTILLKSVNNVGSTTLFNPVKQLGSSFLRVYMYFIVWSVVTLVVVVCNCNYILSCSG